MTIPLDPRFIPAFSIEDVLLDKDTGAPMSGGLVYFEKDNQRGVLKPVYQITGTSPNYTFIQLPNPMILTAIGTFEDALDNPTIPYFFPYDADGNVELYYIRVTNFSDVPQFDREAQPYLPSQGTDTILSVITNELSNPQFAEVLFDTFAGSYTFNVNAVTDSVIGIAPDWDIIVTAAGAGTITVTQLKPAGSANIITNPGTLLTITSSGLSKLQLRQRIFGSPNLWGSGYIGASFVAKTYGGAGLTLNMYYSQSNGSVVNELLVAAQLTSDGNYGEFAGSMLIPASTSSQTYPTAYVDIFFDLPLSVQVDITSVMLSFTGATSINNLEYDQDSTARQIDHLFHYYKPQLEYKPIPSYLVGWDFPLNPAQFLGRTVAASAIGANKSKYVWDQTLIFQSANSGVGVTGGTAGEIVLTAAATTQAAIIQYLSATEARKILNERIAVHVAAKASAAVNTTISLWYTTDASLPNAAAGTNNSLVLTLGTNGKPATFNGSWTEVPRDSLGDALFAIETNATTSFNDYAFSGWDLDGAAGANTATFFAIVIGVAQLTMAQTVSIYSVGLCSGDIATRPAPLTFDQTLEDCQYYYEKSYTNSVVPGTVPAAANLLIRQQRVTATDVFAAAFDIQFNSVKRSTTTAVTLYSPSTAGTANLVLAVAYMNGTAATEAAVSAAGTNWTENVSFGQKGRSYTALSNTVLTTGANEGFIAFHYTADARLGIV